jgi:methionine-rich copper-binding protein CopC
MRLYVRGEVMLNDAPTNLSTVTANRVKFTGVTLLGADKKAIPTGDAKLDAGADTKLIVPLAGTLAAGTYTVEWHALSSDGHKTKGDYTFSIKP